MSASSITYHLFHGPHSGYLVTLVGAVVIAIRSITSDVFIDESESGRSERSSAKWGIKATAITRPIMPVIALSIAAFALWKMWQP